MTNYRDIITVEPGKRGGKPCIRGMRIVRYSGLSHLRNDPGGNPAGLSVSDRRGHTGLPELRRRPRTPFAGIECVVRLLLDQRWSGYDAATAQPSRLNRCCAATPTMSAHLRRTATSLILIWPNRYSLPNTSDPKWQPKPSTSGP